MEVEEHSMVAEDICLHPRAAWRPAGRAETLKCSKVHYGSVKPAPKTSQLPHVHHLRTRDAALALPTLLNPSSPCQSLSKLLREVIMNDALLFIASRGYNLEQKCSLESLEKNNQLQTL